MRPRTGDILEASRGTYYHAGLCVGVYEGDDMVVHHAGVADGQGGKGPIRLQRMDEFTQGWEWRKRDIDASPDERKQAARWALNQVGKCGYNVLWNNCEHLVTAAYGEPRSRQVEGSSAGAVAGTPIGLAVTSAVFSKSLLGGLIILPASALALTTGLALGAVLGALLGLSAAQWDEDEEW